MGPGELVSVIAGALGLGAILPRVVTHWLSRGKVQFNEAFQIREEMRVWNENKNKDIERLKDRITVLEAELDKAEQDRTAIRERFGRFQLDVYRTMVDANAPRQLIDAVLEIQKGGGV